MRVVWLALLVGCYNPTPFQPCFTVCETDRDCQSGFVCGGAQLCRPTDHAECQPGDASTVDAAIDANPNETCFGQGFIKNYCIQNSALPTNDVVIATATLLNTETSPQCTTLDQTANGAPDICLVIVRNWTISSNNSFHIQGSRPLAILATQDIRIAGTLSAESLLASAGGGSAGTAALLCGIVGNGTLNTMAGAGGGGGAGGALTGKGGGGGNGGGSTAGGLESAARPVTFVRGGCDGGLGGNAGGTGGARGVGGGAVYLLAGGMLMIGSSGVINASGSGGGGSTSRAGGGGGGSGGFIGLDAKQFSISTTARVFASGGSGGAGAGAMTNGNAGGNATPNLDPPITLAPDAEGAGTGGNGSSGNGGPGGNAGAPAGGGGGGGGGGYVGYAGPYTAQSLTVVRPAAALMP